MARPEGSSERRCDMNEKIQRMIQEIERRGGTLFGLENMPDAVAEQFLRDILSCPDCCRNPFVDEPTIDTILAGSQRLSDH